jgi:hypothetical protein
VRILLAFATSNRKRNRSFVKKPSVRNGLHVGYSMTQNAHRVTSHAVRKFPRGPEKSSEIPKLAFIGREPAVASGLPWPTSVILTAPARLLRVAWSGCRADGRGRA